MIAIASTGIGTGVILAVGWACVGWAIFEAAGHFYDFFNALGDAETDAELDKAAGMLARGITALGVGALINFLTRGAARASTAGGKAVQQAVEKASKQKQNNNQIEERPRSTSYNQKQLDKAKKLGVDPKWINRDGTIRWPPNDGFVGTPVRQTLKRET